MIPLQRLQLVVEEQREEWLATSPGIERQTLKKILPRLREKNQQVQVISGLRRAGKSTLMRQLMEQLELSWWYINFDDDRLTNMSTEDFQTLHEVWLQQQPKGQIIFMDEIQNIYGWELFVNRMLRSGYRIVITGSNASLLSQELGTHLTGRHQQHELFPFSFKEYVQYHQSEGSDTEQLKTSAQWANRRHHFHNYLQHGGIPFFLESKRKEDLRSLYDDILLKDIAIRYGIRHVGALVQTGNYVLNHSGRLLTASTLQKSIEVKSVNTVQDYLEYFTRSYLIERVHFFSASVRKLLHRPQKMYVLDNGLAKAMDIHGSPNQGQLLENLVYQHLRRSFHADEISYYHTKSRKEVDFVITQQRKPMQLIQVSFNLNALETQEREYSSLVQAAQELEVKDLQLITYGQESKQILRQGHLIQIQPAETWLWEEATHRSYQ